MTKFPDNSWHESNGQNSWTFFQIPGLFPDLEKIWFPKTFPSRGNSFQCSPRIPFSDNPQTVFYPFFWKSTKLTEEFITFRFFKHISGFCCITNILTLHYNQEDTRSHVACIVHIWFNYVSISGNIINILSISIERTVTVLFPLKAKLWITTFGTKKVFLITWYSVNFRIQILLVFENHKNSVLIQAHIKGFIII